jgi:hypothetical protein
MARLHAYGGDNGTKALSEFDTVDLQALALARTWGLQNGHNARQWTYTPCPRPDCGGAVVSGYSDACILCARVGGLDPAPVARVNGYRPRRHASGAL